MKQSLRNCETLTHEEFKTMLSVMGWNISPSDYRNIEGFGGDERVTQRVASTLNTMLLLQTRFLEYQVVSRRYLLKTHLLTTSEPFPFSPVGRRNILEEIAEAAA